MSDDKRKITLEEAKKMLKKAYPRGIDLVYVDYRDDLREDLETLQDIVHTGHADKFYDKHNEWIGDAQCESAREVINEVFKDVDIEDIEDDVRQTVWDMDTSNPLKDLLKNTRAQVMYYDLGLEVPGYPENNEKAAKEVAKVLKMDFKSHRDKLIELVANAGYGGNLCLLFSADVEWFYNHGSDIKGMKYVVIKGADVCIMDRWQGSGHSVSGLGDFKVRFIRDRFMLDEAAPGYSFAGDVCGMTVDEASLLLTNDIKGVIGPKAPREISEKERAEIAYEKKWRETGECSFGDMDPNRHKDTPYRNEFPCGSKCTKCGTFWID